MFCIRFWQGIFLSFKDCKLIEVCLPLLLRITHVQWPSKVSTEQAMKAAKPSGLCKPDAVGSLLLHNHGDVCWLLFWEVCKVPRCLNKAEVSEYLLKDIAQFLGVPFTSQC